LKRDCKGAVNGLKRDCKGAVKGFNMNITCDKGLKDKVVKIVT
jgi:hypothetical protein